MYLEINQNICDWFIMAVGSLITFLYYRPNDSRESQTRYQSILGNSCFKCLNGWLKRFRRRHNYISWHQICGKSNGVNIDDAINTVLRVLL